MYGSLLLALVAALIIGHPNSTRSMPFTHASVGLPPGSLRMLALYDPGEPYSATDAGGTSFAAALDPTAAPADVFENAASRGLAALAAGGQPPSLEELIAAASLDTELYSALDMAQPQPGPTVRDLAQVLVNRPELPPGSNKGDAGRSGGAAGYSLLNAIMETQLDADFIEAATEVVTPTITADGLVALSFLGLRDFAFVVSPVTNRIQVMDFGTGTTVTLSGSAYDQRPQPQPFSAQQQPQHRPQVQTLAPKLTVHALLRETKRFFSSYVLHPFTLGSLALFSIFWIVLRMARRAD